MTPSKKSLARALLGLAIASAFLGGCKCNSEIVPDNKPIRLEGRPGAPPPGYEPKPAPSPSPTK